MRTQMQKKHVAYATHLRPEIWLCEILFSIMGICFAFTHDRIASGRMSPAICQKAFDTGHDLQ